MAYVTSLTAARMLEIEASSVISGYIDETGSLILVTQGGTEVNAGIVYGEAGIGVSSVTPFFLQQGKGGNAPSAPMVLIPSPESPWKLTEPEYVANTDLWMTTRVVYSDSTFQYTQPVKSSAYTGVGQAALDASQASTEAAEANVRANEALAEAQAAVADATAAETQALAAFNKATSVESSLPAIQSAITAAQEDADQAISDAAAAQTAANTASANVVTLAGKTGRLIRSTTAPTAADDKNVNNLWLNTSTGQLHEYNGVAWVVITDSRLTAASNLADAANNLANAAQQDADAAASLANAAQSQADSAYSLAGTANSAATTAQSTASSASSAASSAASAAATAQSKADLAFTRALAAADAGGNLLLNGNFDKVDASNVPIEWEAPNATNRFYPSGVSRGGAFCLRQVTATAAYLTFQANNRFWPSATGRAYYVEGWVKAEVIGPAGQQVGFYLQALNKANTTVQTQPITVLASTLSTTAWTKISGRITLSIADIVNVRVGAYTTAGTGGTYLIDDIIVVDITEAQAAQTTADAANTLAGQAKSTADTAAANALLAQSAADTANAKATTADGRMTVSASNPVVGDGSGKPVNAIWEVRSGTTILRHYMWSGTAWELVKLGTEFIGDKAITRAQIGDAAIGTLQVGDAQITNAKIGDLSVGKLTATAGATFPVAVTDVLFAGQAFIDQMVAERAVITGQQNRIKNGLIDTGTLPPWDAAIFTRDTVDKPVGLAASIKTVAGQSTVLNPTNPIEWFGVVPGGKYKFEIWVKASVANSLFYLELRDQAGAHAIALSEFKNEGGGITTGNGVYLMNARTLPTAWTKYTATLTMSNTATKVRIGSAYFNHYNGTAFNAAVSLAGISLKQFVTADVVVNGSVLIGSLAPEVMETVSNNITAETSDLQEALQGEISTTVNDAVSGIPTTYATKTELAETEASTVVYADSIRTDVLETVDGVSTIVETLQGNVEDRNELYDLYFYLSPTDGLVIGQQSSPFKVRLTSTALTFEESGVVVAYISNKKLFITDAEVTNAFTLGKFDFVPRSNGNLSFKYRG